MEEVATREGEDLLDRVEIEDAMTAVAERIRKLKEGNEIKEK